MPEEATPAAQSPAAETAAAPIPETISPTEIFNQMASATITGNDAEYSRLEALLKPVKAAEPIAEPVAEETPAGAAAEVAAEEVVDAVAAESEEEADPETPAGDKPPANEQERFRFKSEEDRAVASIAKAKGISLIEAAKLYAGEPATPKVELKAEPVAQSQVVEQTIIALEAEAEKIEKDIAALAEADALDPGIQKLQTAHNRTVAKLEAKRELATSLAQQETAAKERTADTIKSQWKALEAKNKTDYPDLAKADSTQSLVYQGLIKAWSDPANPNHSKLFEVNAPKLLADESARVTKITPVKPAALPPKPAAKKEIARPAPGSRTTSPPAPEQTPAQRVAAAEAEMQAAMVGQSGARSRPRSTLIIR